MKRLIYLFLVVVMALGPVTGVLAEDVSVPTDDRVRSFSELTLQGNIPSFSAEEIGLSYDPYIIFEEEPNNTRGWADPIEIGFLVVGAFDYKEDLDYFRLEIIEAGKLQVGAEVENQTLANQFKLVLQNASGTQLAQSSLVTIDGFLSS